jgi:hypothetical protein
MPLMSCPSARNVLVPAAAAVALGEAGAVPVGEAEVPGEPAELPGAAAVLAPAAVLGVLEADDTAGLAAELHAVTSKDAPASTVQTAT